MSAPSSPPTPLAHKLDHLPANPGVYLMKNAKGHILYIGKAKVLKNRVRSYFNASQAGMPAKTQRLVRHIADLECIVTGSELEALILEATLIKKWQPPYNIMVRDDKSFPYIRVTIQEDWPVVEGVRKIERDGARYFGPFVPARACWDTIRFIKKHFKLAHCDLDLTKVHPRACLSYHINQCAAPCTRYVSIEVYHGMVREVIQFLGGKSDDLVSELTRQMEQASQELEFERAAVLRDKIFAITKATERQRMVSDKLEEQDVIAILVKGQRYVVQVFHVRLGRLMGRTQQTFPLDVEPDEAALLGAFLEQFYREDTLIPREIVLQYEIENAPILEEWLTLRRGSRVTFTVPKRGKKAELVEMLSENIQKAMALQYDEKAEERNAAVSLAEAVGLKQPPHRIECYDISTIGGRFAVGSMVVWQGEGMAKSEYRRFQVQCREAPDDYQMLREVLTRRFTGSLKEKSAWPDLLVVDGGKGQLNLTVTALEEAGAGEVPVLGVAKGPDRDRNDVYLPGRKNALNMNRHNDAVNLLARIRDEAHRFAITYHRKLRAEASRRSVLEEIPGVGEKRKKELLKHFGSLKRVKAATFEELCAAPGMTQAVAGAVHAFFQNQEGGKASGKGEELENYAKLRAKE